MQEKIIELENKKVKKKRETKIVELKKYFDSNLSKLKVSILKSEEKILVTAFVVQDDNFEEDLYNAINKTFEDNFEIDKISFSLLAQGESFRKIGEITVDINKFKEVSIQDKTVQEKLKLMNYQTRK